MALDLNALLAQTRVEQRLKEPKAALKARVEQRDSAEQKALEYAQGLEKRASLRRALSSEEIDGMRFRWLAEHAVHWERLAGLSLDELRREVDLAIKREAIRRLSELRRSPERKEPAL
jgi:alcohol dehydrogenase class IV